MNSKGKLLLVLLSLMVVTLVCFTAVNAATPWAPNTYYAVGAIVTYNGVDYQCIQAHTSLVGWEPPNVPALWGPIGTSATPTNTNTPSSAASPTNTNTNTPSSGATPTNTNTNTPSSGATPTNTNTNTPTNVVTPTNTNTPTNVATPTNTNTPTSVSGLPKRIMSGYWHTWHSGNPFIKLRDVNPNWDVINIAFCEPVTPGSTNGDMKFVVTGDGTYTDADFRNDIATLHSRGKKIVLSIGGYEGYFSLTSSSAANTFANEIKGFINSYGFDGIDIDLEQSSVQFNPGADPDFRNPTSPKVVYMIQGISSIVNSYGSNFILSWAPETFYLNLGYQFYGGLNGAVDSRAGCWIPMIHALRDRTTYVQQQLYNSGPILAPDGQYYTMGTSAAVVAMCKMLLTGFNVNQNPNYFFPALRPDQVVVGVPASAGAAGSGQISNSALQSAFSTLNSTYSPLRGIMAWSINWDSYQNNNSFVISNRSYLNSLP